MQYSGRVFGGGGGNLWGVLAFIFVSFIEFIANFKFIDFLKSTAFIDIFKTKLRPLGMLTLLAFFISFNSTANATSLPPVPTNIVNAPKAQFIGSFITSAGTKVPTTVTPLNPQFKDCAACIAWIDGSALTSQVAKFTNAGVQAVWNASGFVGYVGDCVDSTTGSSCQTPQ